MEAFIFQGLGRNFLRHLRRTRVLVHVVDAATENPINDYRTVREVCILLFTIDCIFFFFTHSVFLLVQLLYLKLQVYFDFFFVF